MGAGKYRESITVFTPPAGVSDGQGGTLPGVGSDLETPLYASVEVVKGNVNYALGQVATGQQYKVVIRANGPVATPANTRIGWRGITMLVQVVAESERRNEIALTCFDNGRN